MENDKFEKKTNDLKKSIDNLKINNLLIVIGSSEEQSGLDLSISNIPNVDMIKQIGLNVYDLMNKDSVLITENAIKEIEDRF